MNSRLITIFQLITKAREAGFNFGKGSPVNLIHHYGRLGLLPPAVRLRPEGVSGHTVGCYPEECVGKLLEIQRLRADGLRLEEVKLKLQEPIFVEEKTTINNKSNQANKSSNKKLKYVGLGLGAAAVIITSTVLTVLVVGAGIRTGGFLVPSQGGSVLAAKVASDSAYLEINTDTVFNGRVNLHSVNDSFTINTNADTNFLTVVGGVTLDQNLSKASSPSFADLTLASGTIVLASKTQTLTNKTIDGGSNTLTSIANSSLANSKVTISSGTNLSGGGDVSLGSSLTLKLKDDISISSATVSGNLGVVGLATVSGMLSTGGNLMPLVNGVQNIGSSSLVWNNIYANNVIAGSSGTSGFWQRNSGALSPTNITDSLLVGGTATSSANFQVYGLSALNPVASISGSSSKAALMVDNTVGDLFTASSSGLNRFVITQNGNVGIGTSAPAYKLDVNGSANIGNGLTIAAGNISLTGSQNIDATAIFNIGTSSQTSLTLGRVGAPATINGSTVTIGATQLTLNNATDSGTLGVGGEASFSAKITLDSLTAQINATNNRNLDLGFQNTGRVEFLNTSNYIDQSNNLYLGGNLISSGAQAGFWQRPTSTGILAPVNITDSVIVGGTATGSGQIQLYGLNALNPVASISGKSSKAALVVDNTVGDLFTASSSGLNRFVITQNGNVGIGTTAPGSMLTVGSTGQFSVSSAGVVSAGSWQGTAIGATYGGTGINTSASTGVPVISAGTWSVDATQLAVSHGGTGATTLAVNGVLYGNTTSAIQALAVNSTATNKFLTQVSSGAPAWNTIQATDLPGSFAGFANPTANVGLTVVNGSATTAMRSDAAPALSQAIAPTWTGIHYFSSGINVASGSANAPALTVNQNGTADIFTASVTGTPKFVISNAGNVGIGSSIPSQKLDILGAVRLGANGGSNDILNTTAAGGAPSGVLSWGNRSICDSSGNCSGIGGVVGGTGTTNYLAKWSSTTNITTGLLYDNGNGVALNTTVPLASFDVNNVATSTAIASISGKAAKAALIVDNSGTGDLFTASSSGLNRFVITQNGNVGIGTAVPLQKLSVAGAIQLGASLGSNDLLNTAVAGGAPSGVLYWGSRSVCDSSGNCSGIGGVVGGTGTTNFLAKWSSTTNITTGLLYDNGNGVAINTTVPLATFDVRGATVSAIASISGTAAKAALIVDNSGTGDIFTASSSGLNRFVITQNGNVGIGTTSPGALLDVNGNFIIRGTGTQQIAGDVALTTANPTLYANATNSNLNIRSSGTGTLNFQNASGGDVNFNGGTASPLVVIKATTGNVGIGTTSPTAVLQVFGNSTTQVASISAQSGKAALLIDNTIGDLLTASASGLTRLRIDTLGNILPGLDNKQDLGSSPSARWRNLFLGPGSLHIDCTTGDGCGQNLDYEIGVLSSGTGKDNLIIGANGNSAARNAYLAVSEMGNIGIGTTAPVARLDIVGSQNFTAFTAPGALTAGTPTAGGSCTAGTHSYKVTFTSAGNGETTGGTTSNQITCVLTTGQTVPLSGIPTGPAGTISRKVYRTAAGDLGSYLLLTTIADNTTTTYSDTTADGSLGAAAPTSNTTAVASLGTGGTSRLFIDSNGYVGIGLGTGNSALADLDIRKISGAQSIASISGATAKAALLVDNSGTGDIFTASSSGLNRFVITQNGNVGIGSTVPAAALDIVGALKTTTSVTVGNGLTVSAGNLAFTGSQTIDGTATLTIGGTNQTSLSLGRSGASTTINGGPVVVNGATFNSTGTTTFTGGNVGVGTATVTDFKLELGGNIGPVTTDLYNLGSSSLEWNNLYVKNIVTSVATTGTSGFWQRAGGVLAPNAITDSVIIGKTATPSGAITTGSIQFYGVNNLTPVASISAVSAPAAFIVDNAIGDLFTASSSGLSRFVITQNGNVGIGTTTPAAPLLVNSSGVFNTTTGAGYAFGINYDSSTVGGPGIEFTRTGVNDWTAIQADLSGSTRTLKFIQTNVGVASTQMVINAGTGNVGINTTAPVGTLDVRGTSGTSPVATISGQTAFAAMVVDNKGVGDLFTASSSGLNRFVITQNGNVGIGTTAPGNKLTISTGASGDDTLPALGSNGGKLGIFNQDSKYGLIGGVLSTGNVFFQAQRVDGTATAYNLLLQPNGGNVGIGTTGPGYKLQVIGTKDSYGGIVSIDDSATSGVGVGGGIVFQGKEAALQTYYQEAAITSYKESASAGNYSASLKLRTTNSAGAMADAVTINSGGNVGIGTTGPLLPLDVSVTGTGNVLGLSGTTFLNTAGTQLGLSFKVNSGVEVNRLDSYIESANNFALRFFTYNSGFSEKMRISASGNVGIGTTNPLNKLDVRGGFIQSDIAGGTSNGMKFGATGNQVVLYDDGVGNPYIDAANGTNANIPIYFRTKGTGSFNFINGNVGIGTTLPGEKLEVAGNIKLSGIIKGSDIGVSAYHNANQSGGSTWTTVSLNSENWNTDTMHNTVTNNSRLTANTAGKYVITATADFTNIGWVIQPELRILLNGVTVIAHSAVLANNNNSLTITTVYSLAATNYVELQYLMNTGGSGQVNSGVTFAAQRIAGADIAEYYPAQDLTIGHGDLIAVSASGAGKIVKTTSPYQKPIGVISTNPAMVLGNTPDPDSRLVGLAGRVPLKVIVTNDNPINPGDSLTSSDLPGVAMKANRAGFIAATALEGFDPAKLNCLSASSLQDIQWTDDFGLTYGGGCYRLPNGRTMAKVMTIINNSWYDPGGLVSLADLAPDISASLLAIPQIRDEIASVSAQMADVSARLAKVETQSASMSAVLTSRNWSNLSNWTNLDIASLSAELATISGNLTVLGKTQLADTSIGGTLSVGLLHFDDVKAAISSLTGQVTIDNNLMVMGNATVSGQIRTEKGLVLKDTATGEDYCVQITNGEVVRKKGTCQ